MQALITFIYFEKYKNSLFRASYHKKHILLANCLKMNGINSRFFLNDKLGSLPDLLDELDFYESETICILLDNHNFDFANKIGKAIQQNMEEKKVIYLLDCDENLQKVEGINLRELYPLMNKLLRLIDQNGDVSLVDEKIYNIYSGGTAYLNMTNLIGVSIEKRYFDDIIPNSFENAYKELDYISNKAQDGQEVYIESDDIVSILMDKRKRQGFADHKSLFYSIEINLDDINEKIFKYMYECRIKKVKINIGENSDIKSLESVLIAKKYGISMKFEINIDKMDRDILSNEVAKVIKSNNANITDFNFVGEFQKEKDIFRNLHIGLELGRYSALLNGMECLFTGLYQNNVADGNIKHLVVESLAELTEENFRKLTNYMGLNSAIYYFDREGVGESVYSYDEIKRNADKADYFLDNFIVVKYEDDKYRVYINNDYVLDLYIHKYSDITMQEDDVLTEYYTYIKDEADLVELKKDIDNYYKKGKVRAVSSRYKVINMCRWVENKNCFIKRIPRAQLSNGQFYFCGERKKSCGNLDNMIYETTQEIFIKKEKKEIVEECLNCIHVEGCSKCSFFESNYLSTQYCNLRSSNDEIGIYISNMRFLKAIFGVSVELKGQSVDEFTFFCKSCDVGIENIHEGKNQYLMSGIQLFEHKSTNKYYVCNPYLKGLLGLNKDMYFITKLLVKKLSVENMLEIISEKYNINRNSAIESLKHAFDLLRKKGCLSTSVNIESIV